MSERERSFEDSSFKSFLPPEIMRSIEQGDWGVVRAYRAGLEPRGVGIEEIIDLLEN